MGLDGPPVLTISVPQLEMQPFVPGLAVPGAPFQKDQQCFGQEKSESRSI